MKVLGFDPSLTNFGWVLHDTDGVGPTRCLSRGRFKTSAKTLYITRYMDMRSRVLSLVEQTGVKDIGLEFPVFKDLWSEGMYGLFLYVSEALYEAKTNVVFFSPNQVKAHARLFLNRPQGWKMMKPDMVEATMLDVGGGRRWNHNEADAYWVAKTAGRFWQLQNGVLKEQDLTEPERKQFMEIHTYNRGKHAGETIEKGILYREDERFFRWEQENQDGKTEE